MCREALDEVVADPLGPEVREAVNRQWWDGEREFNVVDVIPAYVDARVDPVVATTANKTREFFRTSFQEARLRQM